MRFKSYQFELLPSCKQERKMRNYAGACRYIYNKALAIQEERDIYADHVGAINILRAGLARLACEVSQITGQQQEPAEALYAK